MSGDRNRHIFYAEGFGYTTAQLRQIYRSGTAASTATIDTTTVPGRNFLRLPANQYLDITLPAYDRYPLTELGVNDSWAWVIQAKVYIDAASYTNVSANSFLMELMSANPGFGAFGLSPNTSTDQDNWWLRSSDSNTDYAINTNNGPQPAIPMRTVRDVKFILRIRSPGYPSFQAWAYVDDNRVAYTDNQFNMARGLSLNFKGIRLWGLNYQSGDTLWGDVIAYRVWVNDYDGDETLNRGATLTGGAALTKDVRVYDMTPTTTVGGINDFTTVGAGDPITALSTLDDNTYVASSDFEQVFRLKPGLPAQYTGDNSTTITITDSSNVYGFNYMHWGKDLDLSNTRYKISASDGSDKTYRFRYYRLLLSSYNGSTANIPGIATLNGIQLYDEYAALLQFPAGSTMRLNSAGGLTAVETSGSIVNTTVHTALLNTQLGNVNTWNTINALTGADIRINSVVAEYIIDCGVGNIAPNWAYFGITQSQGNTSRLFSAALFGSNDNSSWMLLSDNYDTMSASGNGTTDLLINSRHPNFLIPRPAGMTKSLFMAEPLGEGFTHSHIAYPGDPFAAAHYSNSGLSKTPTPFRQFKDYQFGIETLPSITATYNRPPIPTGGAALFNYPDFSSTSGLVLRGLAAVNSNEIYLTTAGTGQTGNIYRTTNQEFNYDWRMSWNMEIGGGSGADGFVLQWTEGNTLVGDYGGGLGRINLSSTKHQIMFRTWTHDSITWLKDNVVQGDYVIGTEFRGNLYYWADYNHTNSTLSIAWSTVNVKPAPQVTLTDFFFTSGTEYYVGFGAATGSATDNHRLKSWRLQGAEGLIMHLDATNDTSYPESGVTWYDLSGNENHGTFVDYPYFDTTNGRGISFDGSNDRVTIPSISATSFPSFTVAVFFYPTQVSNYRNVMDCNYLVSGVTGNYGPRLEMNSGGTLGWVYSDKNNNDWFYSHNVVGSGLPANQWHCAGITYDGGTNTSKTYYNGALTAFSRGGSGVPTGFVGTFGNVNLGAGWLGTSDRFYKGKIGIVRIYNRVLSNLEMLSIYTTDAGRLGL